MCGMRSMTPATTLWPHPIRPWTWTASKSSRTDGSIRIGGVMGNLESRILGLQTRIRDLEAVIDHLEEDNLYLVDEVKELRAELERREQDTWRPHR